MPKKIVGIELLTKKSGTETTLKALSNVLDSISVKPFARISALT